MIKNMRLIMLILVYIFSAILSAILAYQISFVIGKKITEYIARMLVMPDINLGAFIGLALVVFGLVCIFLIKPKTLVLSFVNLKQVFSFRTVLSYLLAGVSFSFFLGLIFAGITITLLNYL